MARTSAGARLTDADLSRADLTRADLTGADLTGADLTDANLTGADLTGADLTDTKWPKNARFPEGWTLVARSGWLIATGDATEPAEPTS
jgi:hypothetical protein